MPAKFTENTIDLLVQKYRDQNDTAVHFRLLLSPQAIVGKHEALLSFLQSLTDVGFEFTIYLESASRDELEKWLEIINRSEIPFCDDNLQLLSTWKESGAYLQAQHNLQLYRAQHNYQTDFDKDIDHQLKIQFKLDTSKSGSFSEKEQQAVIEFKRKATQWMALFLSWMKPMSSSSTSTSNTTNEINIVLSENNPPNCVNYIFRDAEQVGFSKNTVKFYKVDLWEFYVKTDEYKQSFDGMLIRSKFKSFFSHADLVILKNAYNKNFTLFAVCMIGPLIGNLVSRLKVEDNEKDLFKLLILSNPANKLTADLIDAITKNPEHSLDTIYQQFREVRSNNSAARHDIQMLINKLLSTILFNAFIISNFSTFKAICDGLNMILRRNLTLANHLFSPHPVAINTNQDRNDDNAGLPRGSVSAELAPALKELQGVIATSVRLNYLRRGLRRPSLDEKNLYRLFQYPTFPYAPAETKHRRRNSMSK